MREEISRYLAAKQAEEAARETRIAAEAELIALMPDSVPEEGSRTVEADGYKITLTQRVSRKLDEKAYAMVADHIPPGVNPVTVEEVFKIDDKGCRWLKENEQGLWTILSKAITEKTQKIGVKVMEVKS